MPSFKAKNYLSNGINTLFTNIISKFKKKFLSGHTILSAIVFFTFSIKKYLYLKSTS